MATKTGKTLKQESPGKVISQKAEPGKTSGSTSTSGGSKNNKLTGTDTNSLMQQLMNQYNAGLDSYTPTTAQDRQQQAQNEYKSYYDQLRLAAQQAADQTDLALQQQRAGLQDTYDRQRESTREQYANTYSQADRQMLGRGMQRSSYGAQTLANIAEKGAKAQGELDRLQGEAESNIDAQRTQIAQQLAAQLRQYDTSMQSDILARKRQLEDQDYDRRTAAQQYNNNFALQLAGLAQNNAQFNESIRQFNVQHPATTGGGGYTPKPTGNGKDDKNNTGNVPTQPTDNSLWDRMNALLGNQNKNPYIPFGQSLTTQYNKSKGK